MTFINEPEHEGQRTPDFPEGHQHEIHFPEAMRDLVEEHKQSLIDASAPHPVGFVEHSATDIVFAAICPADGVLFVHCTQLDDFRTMLRAGGAIFN